MERVCKNCEHFVQVSSTSEHIWGDCMKSVSPVGTDGRKIHGAFMWADKTCIDFKPKRRLSIRARSSGSSKVFFETSPD